MAYDNATTVVPLLQLLANNATSFITGEDDVTAAPPPVSPYVGFMELSRFWIQRVLVPLVVMLGVVGNVITIVIMTRRRMRSSTNVYLTALAVSDLLYLLFMFSLSLAHYGLSGGTADLYWTYWRFGLWFTDATSSTSIWLTVTFTVERYIAVCHPMRGKVLCTENRARRVTALVYVLCFLCTASTPFEWQAIREEINPLPTNVTNTGDVTVNASLPVATRVKVVLTELGRLNSYRTVFYWFTSLVFVFLPLILLVVFNSFLVMAVHRSQRQRRHLTQTERHGTDGSTNTAQQENKITVTLIAVVVLFLICQIPTAITLIYTSLTEDAIPGSDKDCILRGLGNIFNLLVTINAACNFILYCALSDKYRRTFAMTFLPRRCWAKRDLIRSSTVMGHSTIATDDSPRLNRSPSIWKSNNDGVTAEYLSVPLNGRDAALKRQQSAYVVRRDSTRGNNPSVPFNRSKSLVSRGDSVGSRKSPGRETSGLLEPTRSTNITESTRNKLLCFKFPGRKNKKQEVKITVSDTEMDGLSSV